jgi:hypothetical protein
MQKFAYEWSLKAFNDLAIQFPIRFFQGTKDMYSSNEPI